MPLHESTFEHLKPTDEQASAMNVMRGHTEAYARSIELFVPDGPDRTHALRQLREVAMWCNVAITRDHDGTPRSIDDLGREAERKTLGAYLVDAIAREQYVRTCQGLPSTTLTLSVESAVELTNELASQIHPVSHGISIKRWDFGYGPLEIHVVRRRADLFQRTLPGNLGFEIG